MSNTSYQDVLSQPDRWLTDRQRRWLRPRGALAWLVHAVLFGFNWFCVRLLFRYSVEGLDHLPETGPFILAPNHASPLDPPLLAAALPRAVLWRAYWAGKQTTVLRNWLRRIGSWLARVMPIDEDPTALAPAITILEQGDHLIWFPEGKRALDGQLQEFRPGIAHLIGRCDVPVVPVFIDGAYAAFPSGARLPRLMTKVVVRFGPSRSASQLGLTHSNDDVMSDVAETLRQRVAELGGGR